jgi:23S rRNA U2552 (ribose-2'-O)-methylase RlmE/FtsJ
MKVRLVPRSKIRVSRKTKSKYDKLKLALDELKPGGNAIQIKYTDKKELNSIRNVAYSFNKEKNGKVKSSSGNADNILFFYVDK